MKNRRCPKYGADCPSANPKIYFISIPYGFEVTCAGCDYRATFPNELNVAIALNITTEDVLSRAVTREIAAGV